MKKAILFLLMLVSVLAVKGWANDSYCPKDELWDTNASRCVEADPVTLGASGTANVGVTGIASGPSTSSLASSNNTLAGISPPTSSTPMGISSAF